MAAQTTGQPPTTEQIEAWRAAYRSVAASAVADILATVHSDKQRDDKAA